MAYENFKPVVWSKHIQHELPKFTTFKQDCDYQFDGEAKRGKRVKILGVARPSIKKYTPGEEIDAPEQPQDTGVYMDIDQYDYFNYGIDDVDKAQATAGLMQALSEETTRGLAEAEDTFLAKLMALGAGFVSASTVIATADAAKKALDALFVKLWNNGVSTKDQLTIYLPPWFYDLFSDRLIELKTDNNGLLAKGVLGLYKSARVKMSNNIYNDGTDDYVILKTSKAAAYSNGIDKLEAFRPEKSFTDAIKGLNTYGGKVVRPKELAVLRCREK